MALMNCCCGCPGCFARNEDDTVLKYRLTIEDLEAAYLTLNIDSGFYSEAAVIDLDSMNGVHDLELDHVQFSYACRRFIYFSSPTMTMCGSWYAGARCSPDLPGRFRLEIVEDFFSVGRGARLMIRTGPSSVTAHSYLSLLGHVETIGSYDRIGGTTDGTKPWRCETGSGIVTFTGGTPQGFGDTSNTSVTTLFGATVDVDMPASTAQWSDLYCPLGGSIVSGTYSCSEGPSGACGVSSPTVIYSAGDAIPGSLYLEPVYS